ncbi:hypothetical protein TGAMA5MH_03644 [Trichoderma gamsii]|uniref:Uncharacterized protein n=1 Tax=Trichoderma gamsii TaxID=398673 RepID=A0A2K0TG64_9HYPO|nr:hypothetical protein TGAMA5MH_03644 [Trichoderma gamsii]
MGSGIVGLGTRRAATDPFTVCGDVNYHPIREDHTSCLSSTSRQVCARRTSASPTIRSSSKVTARVEYPIVQAPPHATNMA